MIDRRRWSSKPDPAPGDREARHQALDVPLPRPGQRLVEVVDVEHQPPIRGGEAAEVRQVGIAAELDVQARVAASPARSAAISAAAPRKNVNGDASIRP